MDLTKNLGEIRERDSADRQLRQMTSGDFVCTVLIKSILNPPNPPNPHNPHNISTHILGLG